ncbi:unnamed protein product [Trifolium pratense]|uniref:Uncharacterized protein n=1 Tax=Trifolium pratense TaxID=57577 RepID=A0ACB0LX44_TRIPR|nr:unnamed protein product [Trifolium pratense]
MNVHHITSKNFTNYGKGSDFHEIFELLGVGIFNLDSNEWKHERTLLHSLLKNKIFEIFLQQIIQNKLQNCLLPFLDQASKGVQVLGLQYILERFTFDTTCTSLFGFDPKCLPYNFNHLSEIAYVKAISVLEDMILFIQALYSKSHSCLLKDLMKEGSEKGENFTRYIQDTAVNLLIEGNGTISSGLSWFFWLVSIHPIVEAKIIEEIRDNCLTQGENLITNFSVEVLDKLVYLHRAISEALRLFPPLAFHTNVQSNRINFIVETMLSQIQS